MTTKTLMLRQFALVDFETERATVNRLLAAAVVNKNFCNLLITEPTKAIEKGFADERFDFSPHTMTVLASIRATSLQEYAQTMLNELRWLNTPLAM